MANRFQNFLSRMARKSQTFRYVVNLSFGGPSWTRTNVGAFAREGYAQNPYVYAACNAITQGLAEAPPVLYRVRRGSKIENRYKSAYGLEQSASGYTKRGWSLHQTANQVIRAEAEQHIKKGVPPSIARNMALKRLVSTDELVMIDSHPILDLLERPNGWMQSSYTEFVRAFGLSMLLAGEAFIEPKGNRDAKGVPSELYILPADKLKAETPKEGNPIPGWKYDGRALVFDYSPDPMETELFFAKLYDPLNPLRGLSPMSAAMRSVDLNNTARRYNLSYMQKGGVPPAIVQGDFDTEGAQALRDQLAELAQADAAGTILALSGEGLEYKQLAIDANKLQWGDTTKLTAQEIAIVFGVPPEILGDSSNKTYSNYENARLALYQECVLPLADLMFDAWNAGWVRRFGDDLLLDYDTDQILAIQADVEKVYDRLAKADFLTLNEKREAVGYGPVVGGDVIWVPLTNVPLEAALDDPNAGDEEVFKMMTLANGFPLSIELQRELDKHQNGVHN